MKCITHDFNVSPSMSLDVFMAKLSHDRGMDDGGKGKGDAGAFYMLDLLMYIFGHKTRYSKIAVDQNFDHFWGRLKKMYIRRSRYIYICCFF